MYFQIQFKILGVTFKVLHGMELGYLRDCLLPVVSTYPIQSHRNVGCGELGNVSAITIAL